MIKSALTIILLAFLIASCGRSGPLYLPNKTDDQAEKTTEKTTEKAIEKSPMKDSKKL